METNKATHTPEPWHTFAFEVYDENEQIIADCGLSEDYWEKDGCRANAARIVACVNHCKGATNEELEAQSWEQIKSQRDELLAALKGVKQYMDRKIAVGPPFSPEDEARWKAANTAIANAEKGGQP